MIAADDGTLGVFIAGGQRLVLGNSVTQLTVVPDPFDPTRQAVGMVDGGVARAMPQALIGAGSLGGLLRFQNEDLASARNWLGQMATVLSTRLNEQQALGLDLRTPPGSGAPLFAVGAPVALPATGNGRDAVGNFIASVGLTVADASQLQASEYELRSRPGQRRPIPADAPSRRRATQHRQRRHRRWPGHHRRRTAAVAGDRFLLQPVTCAANEMRRVLADPRGLAAASPLEAVRGITNTGTASVAALAVVGASVNPQNTASDRVHQRQRRLCLGAARPQQQCARRPAARGTWRRASRSRSTASSCGSTACRPMATASRWRRPPSRPPTTATRWPWWRCATNPWSAGQTITDAYASAMAGIGVRVQGARSAADISQAVAANAEAQRFVAGRRQPR